MACLRAVPRLRDGLVTRVLLAGNRQCDLLCARLALSDESLQLRAG